VSWPRFEQSTPRILVEGVSAALSCSIRNIICVLELIQTTYTHSYGTNLFNKFLFYERNSLNAFKWIVQKMNLKCQCKPRIWFPFSTCFVYSLAVRLVWLGGTISVWKLMFHCVPISHSIGWRKFRAFKYWVSGETITTPAEVFLGTTFPQNCTFIECMSFRLFQKATQLLNPVLNNSTEMRVTPLSEGLPTKEFRTFNHTTPKYYTNIVARTAYATTAR
jgi:hypothetical protein